MKIYLIGYMASGKSKLGKELSGLTGLSFVDLDKVFEERYRIGIVDFFDKYGDPAFRQIEHKLLLETAALNRGRNSLFGREHLVYQIARDQYLYPDECCGSCQAVEKRQKETSLTEECSNGKP